MNFPEHHKPSIDEAYSAFNDFGIWLTSNQIGKSTPDLYFYGMVARAAETAESMFHNTLEAPDHTLLILLRNLVETDVRLRYLAQNPDRNIVEFQLSEATERLKIIGRLPDAGEPEDKATEREELLEMEVEKKTLIDQLFDQSTKPTKLSVFLMFKALGEEADYNTYRILSQYEHSNGIGLIGSVVDDKTAEISIGAMLEPEKAELVWIKVKAILKNIPIAANILNSHRPSS